MSIRKRPPFPLQVAISVLQLEYPMLLRSDGLMGTGSGAKSRGRRFGISIRNDPLRPSGCCFGSSTLISHTPTLGWAH